MACSRPLPPLPTELAPTSDDPQHDALEVDQSCRPVSDGESAPIVGHDPKDEKVIGYTDDKIISFDTGKIISYNEVDKQAVVVQSYDTQSEESPPVKEHRIFGMRRKTFKVLLLVFSMLVLAIAIGGGVGGAMAKRNKAKATPTTTREPSPTAPAKYANTGLSALLWTDLNGTLHKGVYYQDSSDRIRESAWDNTTAFDAAWEVNAISDPVKPITPIAAAAGYPHASFNYSLVKNVYYMSTNDDLFERQAASNDSQAWKDDNFSGLYSGSNSTFLAAYWNQNIKNASEELVVLFQEEGFANGITQGRYTSNRTTSNPWVANNFGFSQPKGSTFAMSLVSYRSGKHLMLYTVDDAKTLQQHEYTISDTGLTPGPIVSLTSQQPTGLTVEPRSPLAVVAQDNQRLFGTNPDALPQCMHDTPLTNLIIYTTPDRSSLVLNAWNCTAGFQDHTAEVQPLQKVNTTYLSLAAMSDKISGDGSLYIMFDSGNGPQVEEWTVPKHAGEPWTTTRTVTTDFGL